MSGICGVLRLDGGPADEAGLSTVLNALHWRGPDRSKMASVGPAAFGHALLGTTPEALVEVMPWRHDPTGCLVTADARLDNRADLLGRLDLDGTARMIGDGEIIALAYFKWGSGCAAHLAGDFAFAIWDPRENRLFAARDKLGTRQIIYHYHPGGLFAFATDAEALTTHPLVPDTLDDGRIADLLEGLEASDDTSTMFANLQRLPPAHVLVVDTDGCRTQRYWQLEPSGIIERRDDAAYEEAFLEVLTRSVAARLRAPDGVLGAMLSGGLDSGSAVAIAARLLQQSGAPPLKTVSAVSTNPDCLETGAIRQTLSATPHVDPSFVSTVMPDDLRGEWVEAIRSSPEPYDAHMALIYAVYLTAQKNGIKAMLYGGGGDTLLGSGNVVYDHLRAWRIAAAWREARADERFWEGLVPARKQVLLLARRAFTPQPLRDVWRQLKRRALPLDPDEPRVLNAAFAERANFAARLQSYRSRTTSGLDCSLATRARRMVHHFSLLGHERYDRVAGRFGIESRDPFYDPAIMEFCLTLPTAQLKHNGWPKTILRRSMAGLLPDAVRWRVGRTHIGDEFIHLFSKSDPRHFSENAHALLGTMIKTEHLEIWARADRTDSALAQIDELTYFLHWLTRRKHFDVRDGHDWG